MTKSISRSQVRLIASTNAIFGADEACAMLRISRDAMYRLAKDPGVAEAEDARVDEQGKAGEAQVRHHEVPYRRELARGGAVASPRACGCHRR